MSDAEGAEESPGAGYKRPPTALRFTKGRSGNPKGRPRGRHREVPYHSVLGQIVTVREDGPERRVTSAVAFLLQLTRKGLMRDTAAARASLAATETARAGRSEHAAPTIMRVVFVGFGIGCILRTLGLAVKQNPLDKGRVHWLLEPAIVQAALERFGVRRLSLDEQREV